MQLFHYSFLWSRVKPVWVVCTLEYFQRELSLSSDYMRNCRTCISLTTSYKIFGKILSIVSAAFPFLWDQKICCFIFLSWWGINFRKRANKMDLCIPVTVYALCIKRHYINCCRHGSLKKPNSFPHFTLMLLLLITDLCCLTSELRLTSILSISGYCTPGYTG